jgi:DNA primase (bacterial type)
VLIIKQSVIEQARQTDLAQYCEHKQFDMLDVGSGNYRLIGYSGLIIKDNYFKQFGSNASGNAIDFCTKVLGLDFKQAVKELISFEDDYIPSAKGVGKAELKKKNIRVDKDAFELPVKGSDNARVFSYLTKTRGLPKSLINHLIDKKLLYQDKRGNCVFPCYDSSGQARGAILRGTLTDKPFKGREKNSDVRFGWSLVPKNRANELVVTEAPIDALSLLTIYKEKMAGNNCIIALGGLFVESLKQFLESYSNVHKIILAVDNDAPASEFIGKVKANLGLDYKIKELRPQNKKDWNEVLLSQ